LDSLFNGDVFMDVEDIKPGRDFQEEIIGRIRNCNVVLVLIGSTWWGDVGGKIKLGDHDDYVTLEVKAALETGRAVVPVLIGEVAMPTREELPAELNALASRHAVRLRRDSFKHDLSVRIPRSCAQNRLREVRRIFSVLFWFQVQREDERLPCNLQFRVRHISRSRGMWAMDLAKST